MSTHSTCQLQGGRKQAASLLMVYHKNCPKSGKDSEKEKEEFRPKRYPSTVALQQLDNTSYHS
eukprot:scaffold10729_cov91-Skeletonema_dohrnii-CCMP3373.AAC.8